MKKADETMLFEIFNQVPSHILKDVWRQEEFERLIAQEREQRLAQRQELEQRLPKMHQQHITGMGNTGRAGGRGSGSKPGGNGRRFFTTLPKRIILDGGKAFLSSSLTSGHRRTSGYLGPFAMAKPNETVTAPWRRLLARLPRKW